MAIFILTNMNKRFLLLLLLLLFIAIPSFAQGGPEAVEGGFSLIAVLRGILGIGILLGLGYLISSQRRAINWRIIGIGLGIQFIIAVLVLKVSFFQNIIEFIGAMFLKILDFTQEGTSFLMASFISGEVESPLINFAFWVLPTIIFFSAITSILFYYGIIQKIVYGLAYLLKKALGISGAESLSAPAGGSGEAFSTPGNTIIAPVAWCITTRSIRGWTSGAIMTGVS